jgi:hypothetical protein
MGPCEASWGVICNTSTDTQGRFSLSSPGADPTELGVGKIGYQPAWKRAVSAQEPTANFVLHPSVTLKSTGDTLTGTIWGDEFMAGDDLLFDGLCARTACKVIMLTEYTGSPRPFELTLHWNDAARRLALFISRENDDFFHNPPAPADRYCCSSEFPPIFSLSGYYQAIAVAFEQAAGGPPGPSDSQQFELRIRPVP